MSSEVVTGKELGVSEVVTGKELCVSDLVTGKGTTVRFGLAHGRLGHGSQRFLPAGSGILRPALH